MIEEWTVGMLLNFCAAYDRQQKRMRGEAVTDPEEQYQRLKRMEPEIDRLYAAGQLREAKYRAYKKSLEEWENGI